MPKSTHNYGLILAGGRGTRFWPRSRRAHSKQVLRFGGDRSLIQQTVDRLSPVIPPQNQWILTNDHLRAEIVRQLPEVPKNQILAEPAQRNTAPAIGLAAHILQSIDPNAVMGVFPSDHVISKPARYLQFIRPALAAAARGKIVVLGIQARWPETGYGYIEFPKKVKAGSRDAIPVRRFREKPDMKTARRYVKAGNFYWNAGMFFWKTSVLLDALREYLPKTATLLASLPAFADRRFSAKLKEAFPNCENISIDYAVLEKISGCGRLRHGRLWLERRRKLERRLRTAGARRRRQRVPRRNAVPFQHRQLHSCRRQIGCAAGRQRSGDRRYSRRAADRRPFPFTGSGRYRQGIRKAARPPAVTFSYYPLCLTGFCALLAFVPYWLCALLAFVPHWLLCLTGFCASLAFVPHWLLCLTGFCALLAFVLTGFCPYCFCPYCFCPYWLLSLFALLAFVPYWLLCLTGFCALLALCALLAFVAHALLRAAFTLM